MALLVFASERYPPASGAGYTWLLQARVVDPDGHPWSHAFIQCAEIGRMADEARDGNGSGAVLETDSAGHMVFVTDDGDLHCRAWAPGTEIGQWTISMYSDRTVTLTLGPDGR